MKESNYIRKYLTVFFFLLFPVIKISAEINKITEVFSTRNGQELKMDIYRSASSGVNPCIIHVFGGGFKEGARDQNYFSSYLKYFANAGFTVISIDYRLGMKSVDAKGLKFVKALRQAIGFAVEDIYSATDYIIQNVSELQIDTTRIILSGSSAGAVSVLHADYEHCNNFDGDTILSDNFKFAGIISFAGAILSNKGVPSYKKSPSPTLFFHGTQDRLVNYNKIQWFNLGLFGSKSITAQFRKYKYPYQFYSIENSGHEVAVNPMESRREEILYFIQHLIFEKKPWMLDVYFNDINQKPSLMMSARDFYESKGSANQKK